MTSSFNCPVRYHSTLSVLLILFLSILPFLVSGQGYNKTITLKNFKSINTTINENSFNKIGREFFLMEIDIQDAKYFTPSLKLSQSVFKTRETMAMDELEVEKFYYLLNHQFVYTGAVVSHNLEDYIFSATKRHGAGVLKKGQTLQLYTANIDDEHFVNIEKLPFVEKRNNYCHPSITENGKMLIFASDRPGGHGGYDLYASIKEFDTWSTPVNLGPKVNSLDDELYPFLSSDGYLYFSSDRSGGSGELDIYVSERYGQGWSSAANLGSPYNSKTNDYGFRILNYQGYGTLSSDRSSGMGKDDIYTFRYYREEENKSLIKEAEQSNAIVENSEGTPNSTTNIVNNYYNFGTAGDSKPVDRDVYVIYYSSPGYYNEEAFQSDKEDFLKTLTPIKASKYTMSTLSKIERVSDAFVQIKTKGYEDIILNPGQLQNSKLKIQFVEKGMKHLPGRVIYSDGTPLKDIRVEMKSLDRNLVVTSITDESGSFSSQVATNQNYEVRLYREDLQIHETFEFNPENFATLIIDLPVNHGTKKKVSNAVQEIPKINKATERTTLVSSKTSESATETTNTKVEATSKTNNVAEVLSSIKITKVTEPKIVKTLIPEKEKEDAITDKLYAGGDSGNYYVIAGTFQELRRAKRRRQLLTDQGFENVYLMQVDGSMYTKVCVSQFVDLSKALKLEAAVEGANCDAYILRREEKDIKELNF